MIRTIPVVVLALAAAGCAKPRILNAGVNRTPVVYESSVAQTAAEEALQDRYDGGAADLPPGRLSPNAFFNRELPRLDPNGDSIITEAEARQYANM